MRPKTNIRIALVQDYLKEWGGAEAVFETLTDIFPDADIFTTIYAPQFFGPHRPRLQHKWQNRVHQSFFKYIPFGYRLLSPLRFLSPLAFKSFDFSDYDLIITSATGAFFPNSINKKNAKLICYCHTPPRYLYGLATARDTSTLFYRLVNIPLQFTLHFYRLFDFKFAQNVDQFIANSATTASRIQKYYRKNSIIINPPVDLPNKPAMDGILSAQRTRDSGKAGGQPEGSEHFKMSSKQKFYLTGGRLVRAKRYDIAVRACTQLNLPLKVFGRDFSGYQNELKKMAGPTVQFLGEITQEQKKELYSQAQAYIFPSDNEDFGIVAVEAQSYGCPVIGYNSGGIRETVINGKTGVLFDELTPKSCILAIQKFQNSKINPVDCIQNAQQFSRQNFIKKINSLVFSL